MSFPVPGIYGLIENPLLYPLFFYNDTPETETSTHDFLLMDGEFFLLMDGTNFLLMGS